MKVAIHLFALPLLSFSLHSTLHGNQVIRTIHFFGGTVLLLWSCSSRKTRQGNSREKRKEKRFLFIVQKRIVFYKLYCNACWRGKMNDWKTFSPLFCFQQSFAISGRDSHKWVKKRKTRKNKLSSLKRPMLCMLLLLCRLLQKLNTPLTDSDSRGGV